MRKKRSHGEGSVWKLRNGTWRGQIMDGYTSDGKKRIVSFTGETKSEVLDQIRDHRNNAEAHVHLDKTVLLSGWAELWYADYASQVQASTYSSYRYTLNIIEKHLGSKAVCDILPMDINRFQDDLAAKGYSLSQIRKCRTMLIQIFDSADENGLIVRNPARKAKILKDKDGTLSAPRRIKDSFSEDEIDLLFAGLKDDLMGNSIRLMIDTGLRVQEIIALAPDDIAEDGSYICVNHAVKTVKGRPELGPPKSKASNRTVPVPERSRANARFIRENGGKTLIWSLPGKNPVYNVGSFRRRYYSAIERINGVRKLTPHCLRHTYVTRLQKNGVPIEIIAKLAGHSNVDVTVGYTHTSLETLSDAVAVLDRHTAHPNRGNHPCV